MAQEPLARKGNFLHIYDFRVSSTPDAILNAAAK